MILKSIVTVNDSAKPQILRYSFPFLSEFSKVELGLAR